MLSLIINFGVDVNHQDITGKTALHIAVMANMVKAVNFLMKVKKINFGLMDQNGNSV